MKEAAGMDTSVKQWLKCFEEINQHDSGNCGHRNTDEQAKMCDEVICDMESSGELMLAISREETESWTRCYRWHCM
jgi:hypothetical protein